MRGSGLDGPLRNAEESRERRQHGLRPATLGEHVACTRSSRRQRQQVMRVPGRQQLDNTLRRVDQRRGMDASWGELDRPDGERCSTRGCRGVERVQDVAPPPDRAADHVLGGPRHADQPGRRPSSAIAPIAASTAPPADCPTSPPSATPSASATAARVEGMPLPTAATSAVAVSSLSWRRTISCGSCEPRATAASAAIPATATSSPSTPRRTGAMSSAGRRGLSR
jgi:hypothetical protein